MVDPNDTFTLYLDLHLADGERNAEARRPAIEFRYGSVSFWRGYDAAYRKISEATGTEWLEGLIALVETAVAGVRNLPGETLAGTLTQGHLLKLARDLPTEALMAGLDPKNSESPSRSPAAASAGSATPAADAV